MDKEGNKVEGVWSSYSSESGGKKNKSLPKNKDGITNDRKITTIRILLLGDSFVGKTSFFRRYDLKYISLLLFVICDFYRLEGAEFDENVITTIGVEFLYKDLIVNEKNELKIKIYDTAGQERFQAIAYNYYKGANGIFLMFDLTSRKSFENIEGWTRNIEQHAGKDITKVLIGTKCDLHENREIFEDELTSYIKRTKFKYFETSAKEFIGIEEPVDYIIDAIYKQRFGRHLNDSHSFILQKESKISLIKKRKKGCC